MMVIIELTDEEATMLLGILEEDLCEDREWYEGSIEMVNSIIEKLETKGA